MIVEAKYVGGSGVLLGNGAHWVLVSDPDDEQVLEQVWHILTSTVPSDTSLTEQVLAVVEKAFDGEPPALAIVDFTSGASTTLSRGTGHVRIAGGARILSLDSGADPHTLVSPRSLVGGVVAAERVEVRPLSAKTAPLLHAAEVEVEMPVATSTLIDGIPDNILAAKGPDGPPPRDRTPRRARSHGEDTGSLQDTVEPNPMFTERIEEGTHTTIRPPAAPRHETTDASAPSAHAPDDHDGDTTVRPAHLLHNTAPTVLAVSCPLGHLTPPAAPSCRVCHQRVAPQEARRVQRPTLGGLRLPTGEVVPLDRGVVLGRKPPPAEGSTDWPHLVHLPSTHSFVSRRHLQIDVEGWDVIARDLDSRGGTTLTPPGREPQRMHPGDAYVLEPGSVLDMAQVYAVRFETGTSPR